MNLPTGLAELHRADPVSFAVKLTRDAHPTKCYVRARHLTMVSQMLAKAYHGIGPRNLIITMPPRHGKSWLISKWFPLWVLDQDPHSRVILASYEASFAAKWGSQARALWEEYKTQMRFDIPAGGGHSWITGQGEGGMHTSGVGGSITGRGAGVFIVDDPVKNSEDAMSATMREKGWDWYFSTARSRIEPGGLFILLMTRWHHDDLGGRLLERIKEGDENPEDWKHVDIPALCEDPETDPLGREKGKALWPERYDEEALNKIKKGNRWWTPMYQQRPSPDEGDIFQKKWFRYFKDCGSYIERRTHDDGDDKIEVVRVPKDQLVKFQTIDLATSEKEYADYTVISTWGMDKEANLYLLDVFRERVSGASHMGVVREQFEKHGVSQVGIESVAFQLSMVQRAKRNGLPVIKLLADRDKVSRALLAQARCQAGAVYFKQNAEWLDVVETELLQFPNAVHDDFVDTLAYACWGVAFGKFVPRSIKRVSFGNQGLSRASPWR